MAWGYGTFWWTLAGISLVHEAVAPTREGSFSFSLSAWSLVFPWVGTRMQRPLHSFSVQELSCYLSAAVLSTSDQGVYTNAAVQLGKLVDSAAFEVWSIVLTILIAIIRWINAVLTVKDALGGKLLGLNS